MREIHNVLITGVTGSAGRYFVEYLRKNHPEVEIHGTCRRKSIRTPMEGVRLYEVDLLDFSSIQRCLYAADANVIFHFAANPDKGFEIPAAILQNNVVGTANLLEAQLHQAHTNNAVIINVSSSEVYGDVDPFDVPIKETCPFRPMSPYAVSKAAQDHLGQVYFKAYGMPIITTRAFSYVNLYHHGLFTSHFARQIALIEKGKLDVLKHGNLDSVRCFVGTEDIMEAYWLAATKCQAGQAYNIGGDCVMTVGEVLRRMFGLMRVPSPLFTWQPDPYLMRPADVTMQIPDSTKFRKETGWNPSFNIDTALRGLLDYWRKEIAKHDYYENPV